MFLTRKGTQPKEIDVIKMEGAASHLVEFCQIMQIFVIDIEKRTRGKEHEQRKGKGSFPIVVSCVS